jgi:hypothetical protein
MRHSDLTSDGCSCKQCAWLQIFGPPVLPNGADDSGNRFDAFALGFETGQAGIVCAADLLLAHPSMPSADLWAGYRSGYQSASWTREARP